VVSAQVAHQLPAVFLGAGEDIDAPGGGETLCQRNRLVVAHLGHAEVLAIDVLCLHRIRIDETDGHLFGEFLGQGPGETRHGRRQPVG
jgi:hypothetical protein